jgi:hypothetical protein
MPFLLILRTLKSLLFRSQITLSLTKLRKKFVSPVFIPLMNRAYAGNILPVTILAKLCSTLRVSRSKFVGAYLVAISKTPLFTLADANREFCCLRALVALKALVFTFALEPLPSKKDRTSALSELDIYQDLTPEPHEELTLGNAELRAIHHLCQVTPDTEDLSAEQILPLVHALSSEALTPEERGLKRFTHRTLEQLPTWPLGEAGEHDQLDKFYNIQLYGAPCFAPEGATVLIPCGTTA